MHVTPFNNLSRHAEMAKSSSSSILSAAIFITLALIAGLVVGLKLRQKVKENDADGREVSNNMEDEK